jgi:hypothetical protein
MQHLHGRHRTPAVDAADLLMADADDASSDGMDLDGDDSIAVLLASQDAWALTLYVIAVLQGGGFAGY